MSVPGRKVLLLARDPGAANTLFPLVEPLRSRGYEVLLYGEGRALEKYRQFGFSGIDLADLLPNCTVNDTETFIAGLAPDVLITGTGSETNLEKYAWESASRLGIASLAILDQWVNYGVRFSEFNLYQLDEYRANPRHPYMPDRILVMDETARQGLIADGIPAERIAITGQPYFEFVSERGRHFREATRRDDIYRVLFVSEPISKFSASAAELPHGYSEGSIRQAIRDVLSEIHAETGKRFELAVRLHPLEEDPDHLTAASEDGVVVVIDTIEHPWRSIHACDLVTGMASMLLFEAYLMDKPVLSVQIGLTGEDPFILSRIGCLPTVTDRQRLHDEFSRAIVSGRILSGQFEWIRDPVHRVIEEMENLLCKGLSNKL